MKLFDFFKKKSVSTPTSTITQPDQPPTSLKPVITSSQASPTLQQRLTTAYPSQNGLFPHELLMLSYATSYTTQSNNFQQFWKWEYSVTDPQALLADLLSRGFIQQETPAQALTHLTIPQLKELLVSIGEKVSGKKAELIARILEKYDSQKLLVAIPSYHYALTPNGESEVKQNEYVLYLHRTRYMSVWDMNRFLHEDNPSHLRYRDIIWREFNKQLGQHFQNAHYGLYRNTLFNMHTFLIEEGKPKTALTMLLQVVSYDLSGLGNEGNNIPDMQFPGMRETIFTSRLVNRFSEDMTEVSLYPGIVQSGKKLFSMLALPEADFISFVYQECANIKIHERVFNAEECANIFLSAIGLEDQRIHNSYSLAEQRLRQHLKL